MVNIEMANGKNIKIELYPDVAPITVANFEKLVKEGFYDGLIYDTGWRPNGNRHGRCKREDKGRVPCQWCS